MFVKIGEYGIINLEHIETIELVQILQEYHWEFKTKNNTLTAGSFDSPNEAIEWFNEYILPLLERFNLSKGVQFQK